MRYFYVLPLFITACTSASHVGKTPDFTLRNPDAPHVALYQQPSDFEQLQAQSENRTPSLWTAKKSSLLGDRRAEERGDILTVVIDINDQASISNSSGRKRAGAENLGISGLFGIPQRVDPYLPEGATLADAVGVESSSTFSGSGSVARNEKITLRVAATVVEELPNKILKIEGRQEVRINFELRELIVSGYVRPADISRQNEITYDKIAEARISYGGRGHISDVQQPRYGQQITDTILPF